MAELVTENTLDITQADDVVNKSGTKIGEKNLCHLWHILFFFCLDNYEKHFNTHSTILHHSPPPLLPGKNLH